MKISLKCINKVTDEEGLCLHFENEDNEEFRWYPENEEVEMEVGKWYYIKMEVLGEGYDTLEETGDPHKIIEVSF